MSKSLLIFLFCLSAAISNLILSQLTYAEEQRKITTPQRQTILDFKVELNLNENQIKDIEKLLSNFKKKEAEFIKEIQKHDRQLKELLQKEGDINEIKKEVREIYKLRGELVAEELETARKIDGVLTAEQKQKWKEIRAGKMKK